MTVVLLLHIACVFAWLTWTLAETMMERMDIQSAAYRLRLEALMRIGSVIELPAFLGVLLTGGYLASRASMSPILTLKIAAGVVAIGVNVYCLLLVKTPQTAHPRLAGARNGTRAAAVALVASMIAMAIGAHVFVAA